MATTTSRRKLMGHPIDTISSSSRFEWKPAQTSAMSRYLQNDETIIRFITTATKNLPAPARVVESMFRGYTVPDTLYNDLDLGDCIASRRLRDVAQPKIIRKLMRLYNESLPIRMPQDTDHIGSPPRTRSRSRSGGAVEGHWRIPATPTTSPPPPPSPPSVTGSETSPDEVAAALAQLQGLGSQNPQTEEVYDNDDYYDDRVGFGSQSYTRQDSPSPQMRYEIPALLRGEPQPLKTTRSADSGRAKSQGGQDLRGTRATSRDSSAGQERVEPTSPSLEDRPRRRSLISGDDTRINYPRLHLQDTSAPPPAARAAFPPRPRTSMRAPPAVASVPISSAPTAATHDPVSPSQYKEIQRLVMRIEEETDTLVEKEQEMWAKLKSIIDLDSDEEA